MESVISAVFTEYMRWFCLGMPINIVLCVVLKYLGDPEVTGEMALGLMFAGPIGTMALSYSIGQQIIKNRSRTRVQHVAEVESLKETNMVANQHGHCAYCACKILENLKPCPICDAPHHEECWVENGNKCGIYGCGNQPNFPQALAAAQIAAAPRQTGRSESSSCWGWIMPAVLIAGMVSFSYGLDTLFCPASINFGEVVLRFDNFQDFGTSRVLTEPRSLYLSRNAGNYVYKTCSYYQFGKPEGSDRQIEARFNDGVRAEILGSFRYEVPTENSALRRLVTQYGPSQAEVEKNLIHWALARAFLEASSAMSSWDVCAEKRAVFIEKVITKFTSELADRGIRVYNFTIYQFVFPSEVEGAILRKIAAQREANRAEAELAQAKLNLEKAKFEKWKILNEAWKNAEKGDIVPTVRIK